MAYNNSMTSEYTQTYTSFSGCDIVCTFGAEVIGSLQAISYSVSREKAPVYTFGSAEPRSFSRGKRGIAGSMVFSVFDQDALLAAMKRQSGQIERIVKLGDDGSIATDRPISIDQWDELMTGKVSNTSNGADRTRALVEEVDPHYADEIPPFDVTISFANEYGQKSVIVIYGVEILNEGTGFSTDTVTSERATTFVARRLDPMRTVENTTNKSNSSSR